MMFPFYGYVWNSLNGTDDTTGKLMNKRQARLHVDNCKFFLSRLHNFLSCLSGLVKILNTSLDTAGGRQIQKDVGFLVEHISILCLCLQIFVVTLTYTSISCLCLQKIFCYSFCVSYINSRIQKCCLSIEITTLHNVATAGIRSGSEFVSWGKTAAVELSACWATSGEF